MTQPPPSFDPGAGGQPGPEVPPPGYGAPPPGYPAGAPGFPGGFPAAPPPGYPSSEDKTWALVAHFGGAVGMFIGGGVLGWVAPLIALLVQGSKSPTARAHAVNALNFQLLWSIVGLVGWITLCFIIGAIILPLASIFAIVMGIVAGIKANDGQLYKYPAAPSMIK